MEIDKLLTPAKAAAVIGCSHRRVTQMLREGRLKGKKVSDRVWLIEQSEAERMRDFTPATGRPRKS